MSINLEKSGSGFDTQLATPYTIPRVNLLPGEVLERRAVRRVQTGIAAAALTSALLAGGAYFLVHQDASRAADQLAAEQSVTATLNAEQARYAEVPKTIAMVEQAVAARDTAMAQDIAWSTVMGQIAATYPSQSWVTTLTASLSNPPGTAGTAASATTSDAVATMTFQGGAKSHPVVASWLDSLNKVPSVDQPKLQSTVLNGKDGKKSVDYATTTGLDRSAFTSRAERTGN